MLKGPGVWNGQEFGKNEVYRVFGWLSAGTTRVGGIVKSRLIVSGKDLEQKGSFGADITGV